MNVIFDEGQNFDVNLSEDGEFDVEFSGVPKGTYTGEYSVTPSDERQYLPTEGKTLTQDIVVEPIPSNYGLVTWDGSILMIS